MANLNIIQGNLTYREYKEYIGQIMVGYYEKGDTVTLSRNMKEASKQLIKTVKQF